MIIKKIVLADLGIEERHLKTLEDVFAGAPWSLGEYELAFFRGDHGNFVNYFASERGDGGAMRFLNTEVLKRFLRLPLFLQDEFLTRLGEKFNEWYESEQTERLSLELEVRWAKAKRRVILIRYSPGPGTLVVFDLKEE